MKPDRTMGSATRSSKPTLTALACLGLAALTAWPATTRHVWQDSPNPSPPYADWTTAAHDIQAAVDAAAAGDEIVVTNGTYATGGRALTSYPLMTNRVVIDKAVTVRSVNGPAVTAIAGHPSRDPSPRYGPNGDGAVRCVYVTSNAVVSGFTLFDGHTRRWPVTTEFERAGGAAWCETGAGLSNCVLTVSSADLMGGGAYGGTLIRCTVTGNQAETGGGAAASTLNHCNLTGNFGSFGGAAGKSTLNHCVLTANSSWGVGGGADASRLNFCTLTGNSAMMGGGASGSTLNFCTIAANAAEYDGGGTSDSTLNNSILSGNRAGQGGGAFAGTLNNCTIIGNVAGGGGGVLASGESSIYLANCIVAFNFDHEGNVANWDLIGSNPPKFEFCCTSPLPPGEGNIASDPLFLDEPAGGFRLRPDSPCLNAGSNEAVVGDTDVGGNPRIIGGRVDIGAHEMDLSAPVITRATWTSDGLRLEWQAADVGSTLQRAATLDPARWQDVPGSEAVTNLTVPLTDAAGFFRLVKP